MVVEAFALELCLILRNIEAEEAEEEDDDVVDDEEDNLKARRTGMEVSERLRPCLC